MTKLQGRLQVLLQQKPHPALSGLCFASQEFLNTLKRNYLQLQNSGAIQLVKMTISHITDALEALQVTEKTEPSSWTEQVERTAKEQREKLVAATIDKLSNYADGGPPGGKVLSQEALQTSQRLEGLLFSEANLFTAEHFKFDLLKQSLLAESRITRIKLAGYLQGKSASMVMVARQARKYLEEQLQAQIRETNKFDETELAIARVCFLLLKRWMRFLFRSARLKKKFSRL